MSNLLELEMGYTLAEFARTLNGQFSLQTGNVISRSGENSWRIDSDDGKFVSIKLTQKAPRKIAMLTLPVTQVFFEFHAFSEAQQKDFMRVFFKYFHKGGG